MINFIKNILNLLKTLYIISKYEILTNTGELKLPIFVKIIGSLIRAVVYPKSLINPPSKEIFGKRLADAITQLGPVYIKLGQTLSTRPDIIGVEISENLKFLQDKLAPFDFAHVQKIIKQDLNDDIENIFSSFEARPVAAASIAQVHKAVLKNGQTVAVKILRPDIHAKYHTDIKFLEFVAKILTYFIKKSQRFRPLEIINVFRKGMETELNLSNEAAASCKLRENFEKRSLKNPLSRNILNREAKNQDLFIPRVFWALTSENILTSEWAEGVSIYNNDAIKSMGFSTAEIASKIAVIFFYMAYQDGFFHADMHPGNILVRQDGSIALIDFGIMGSLPEKDRIAVAEVLHAIFEKNYDRVARIHKNLGYVPQDTNLDRFALSMRSICDPVLDSAIKNISIGNLLAKLFKVSEEYGMEVQPQLISLQKTIVVVEGIGQSLDPEINMWKLAEPWIKKWAIKNLTPEAKIFKYLQKKLETILDAELSS